MDTGVCVCVCVRKRCCCCCCCRAQSIRAAQCTAHAPGLPQVGSHTLAARLGLAAFNTQSPGAQKAGSTSGGRLQATAQEGVEEWEEEREEGGQERGQEEWELEQVEAKPDTADLMMAEEKEGQGLLRGLVSKAQGRAEAGALASAEEIKVGW